MYTGVSFSSTNSASMELVQDVITH